MGDRPGRPQGAASFCHRRIGQTTVGLKVPPPPLAVRRHLSYVGALDRSKHRSAVAQWLACWAHNPKVRGSKPRCAILVRVSVCAFLVSRCLRHLTVLRRDFVADLGLGVVAPPGGMQIAAGEDRTPDLRIMRPTRCQLRYCRMYWFTVALLVWSPSCVIVVSLRRLRFSALRKYIWVAPIDECRRVGPYACVV